MSILDRPPGDGDAGTTGTFPPLPFDFDVVPGKSAADELARRRAADPTATPVLVGDEADVAQLVDYASYSDVPVDELLAAADALSLADYLSDRRATELDDVACDEGEWPSEPATQRELFLPRRQLSTRFKSQVAICRVPTACPAEVPAWFRFGGWNDCPDACAHVAFCRDWAERFGAAPVALAAETLEFRVDRPPTTRDAARALAEEQFEYCPDLVVQGYGTLRDLAASLIDAPCWSFWWD